MRTGVPQINRLRVFSLFFQTLSSIYSYIYAAVDVYSTPKCKTINGSMQPNKNVYIWTIVFAKKTDDIFE